MVFLFINGVVSDGLPRALLPLRPFTHSTSYAKTKPSKLCVSQLVSQQSIKEHHLKQNETASSIHVNSDPNILFPTSCTTLQDHPPPLVSALKACAEKDSVGFHFPGHNRGRAAPPSLSQLIGLRPFLHDLPELSELDDLFSPKGVILDAQKQAAELFGSSETWFLVGGTTCGVQASIMATCSPGDSLILSRNSHISAMSGMVLAGATPKYILPEYNSQWDISGGTTSLQVERAIGELKTDGRSIGAVLVTSPTYHGICSDIALIADLCHSNGIPVIVDEAHGAHFKFHHKMPSTCLEQGADISVQSTHKVLCSLTQSSMLHRLGNIVDRERLSRCLQMLQSTSPSYLLLASLDAARAQLSKNPHSLFDEAVNLSLEARHLIQKISGLSLLGPENFSGLPHLDPLRVTVGLMELGLFGYEADKILCEEYNLIAELAGTRSLTFAINLGTCREHIRRLVSGLECLSAKNRLDGGKRVEVSIGAPFTDISMRLTPRDAFFASKRKVRVEESLGEVCGELVSSYPPGIPVLLPGEIITERALNYLLGLRNKGAVISGAADLALRTIVVCR